MLDPKPDPPLTQHSARHRHSGDTEAVTPNQLVRSCGGHRGWEKRRPGTARPIPACRRSPQLSPVPVGTGLGSSVSATGQRRSYDHEDGKIEASSLRNLHPRFH